MNQRNDGNTGKQWHVVSWADMEPPEEGRRMAFETRMLARPQNVVLLSFFSHRIGAAVSRVGD